MPNNHPTIDEQRASNRTAYNERTAIIPALVAHAAQFQGSDDKVKAQNILGEVAAHTLSTNNSGWIGQIQSIAETTYEKEKSTSDVNRLAGLAAISIISAYTHRHLSEAVKDPNFTCPTTKFPEIFGTSQGDFRQEFSLFSDKLGKAIADTVRAGISQPVEEQSALKGREKLSTLFKDAYQCYSVQNKIPEQYCAWATVGDLIRSVEGLVPIQPIITTEEFERLDAVAAEARAERKELARQERARRSAAQEPTNATTQTGEPQPLIPRRAATSPQHHATPA